MYNLCQMCAWGEIEGGEGTRKATTYGGYGCSSATNTLLGQGYRARGTLGGRRETSRVQHPNEEVNIHTPRHTSCHTPHHTPCHTRNRPLRHHPTMSKHGLAPQSLLAGSEGDASSPLRQLCYVAAVPQRSIRPPIRCRLNPIGRHGDDCTPWPLARVSGGRRHCER